MRYWGYFAGKLAGCIALIYGMLTVLAKIWPSDPGASPLAPLSNGNQVLLCSLGYMVCFLFSAGLVYAAVLDQRRRCRVCLRRLRMPVRTGSWSKMLELGRPRIEYICPYGHGTLKEAEVTISGRENSEWTPHSDDLWEALCASGKDPDRR